MIKSDREYRKAGPFDAGENYTVEGYASTFDPYVLFTSEDGTNYSEKIDRSAFDKADMSDVIFLYNHEGRVYARQKNNSLELSVDDHGLKVRADLSATEGGRQLYEEIKAGLIDQMSFAFTVEEDSYAKDTHTRTISRIRKVYDVSAVSIPANPSTEISARSYFDGVIEAERAERLAAEKRAEQVRRINIILGVKENDNP